MIKRTLPILVFLLLCSFGLGADRDAEMDKILLTAPAADPVGQPILKPVVFNTKRFSLKFSAAGVPVSIVRKSDGVELVAASQLARKEMGFFLRSFDNKIIPLRRWSKRKDGGYVVASATGSQRIVFDVKEKDRYLTFRIKEFYGIPTKPQMTLAFDLPMNRPFRKTVALDYMTRDYGRYVAEWPWLWWRGSDVPKGGFALYIREDFCKKAKSKEDAARIADLDEDDTFLRIGGAEGIPHPKLPDGEKWDYARARKWIIDWRKKWSDISESAIQFPESMDDVDYLLPYLKKAKIRLYRLYGRVYADRTHHCWIKKEFFPNGKEDLRRFAEKLNANGMALTIHYDFNVIPYDDPVFVGTKPRRDLESWGKGALAKPIGKDDTTLLFRPEKGLELPFTLEKLHSYPPNPPALSRFHNYDKVRVNDEIISVGQFLNTDQDVWILRNCQRGFGSTLSAAHKADDEAVGLVTMYRSYLPALGSKLYDDMVKEHVDLVNYCKIDRFSYDGLNPCNFANARWSYRKWTSDVYSQVDHPLLFASGYGAERYYGHFEYRISTIRNKRRRIMDLGTRIRNWHISRPASTLDEAHFRMSQAAAYDLAAFDYGFACHYPSRDWKNHGMLGPIAETVGLWKDASKGMTQKQRDAIKATLKKPFRRGYTGEVVWKVRSEGDVLKLYPTKNPLTREKGDARWGCSGSEMGYLTPGQYFRVGSSKEDSDVLRLGNPYKPQPPRFSLRFITAVDYESQDNISLQPLISSIENPLSCEFKQAGDALILKQKNRNPRDAYSAKDREALMPIVKFKKALNLEKARGMGLWVTGDGSGALLLVRYDRLRDYVIRLSFKGRRYFEIPCGEAYWVEDDWGGPNRCATPQFNYRVHWVKFGFGEIPPGKAAVVKVEGLKVLAEKEVTLRNPVIHLGESGSMSIMGQVRSHQQLRYTGGGVVGLYDRNWNKLKDLPVKREKYRMGTGYEGIHVTADGPRTWAHVRFSTEGDPLAVRNVAQFESDLPKVIIRGE